MSEISIFANRQTRAIPHSTNQPLSNLAVEFQSLALPTSLLTAFSVSCGRTFKAGVLSSLYFSRTCFLIRRLRSSYEKGCQGKKLLPAPLRDAGVVTYIQPRPSPHLIFRGVIGLVALARRTFPRRCQPQLLVPTRWFHEVGGTRRRSVTKLRKLSVGLSANHDPMRSEEHT